jgi:protein TonB
MLAAMAVHGAIVSVVNLEPPTPPPWEAEQSLEITVVRPKPTPPPEKADFLAATDQAGSGNIDEVAKPKANPALKGPADIQTALHNLSEPAPPEKPAEPEPETVEPEIVQAIEDPPEEKKVTEEDPGEAAPRRTLTATQLLANMQQQIDSLTAELDRKTELYAKRPRRKAISAATREHKYAAYLEAWRRKVESVGNLNYPAEARERKLYGDLILHVALRPNGSVQQVRVVRSSGHDILDDAAINIVNLAAPFSPFPPSIKDEVDILDITRTWQFLRGNRLGSR